MSALKIAPALHTPADRNAYSTPLLTHSGNGEDAKAVSANQEFRRIDPMAAPISAGSNSHIQAQILAGSGYRSFRRPVANSPRDAARAYAQTRRRPGTVSAAPQLKAVV